MTRLSLLIPAAAAGLIAFALPASAQSAQDTARFTAAQDRLDREIQLFRQESDRYRAAVANNNRQPAYDPRYDDPRNGGQYRQAPNPYDDSRDERGYDPSQEYRSGSNYQPRVLGNDERVYAGNDGRYYCKRSDGTTGLILGAAGGGVLGNVIAGGRSRTVGTLIGGALGAVAGRAIQQSQNQVRCQ